MIERITIPTFHLAVSPLSRRDLVQIPVPNPFPTWFGDSPLRARRHRRGTCLHHESLLNSFSMSHRRRVMHSRELGMGCRVYRSNRSTTAGDSAWAQSKMESTYIPEACVCARIRRAQHLPQCHKLWNTMRTPLNGDRVYLPTRMQSDR